MKKINVMVVEDQSMPRQLFEIFISSTDKYNLTASIDDASKALNYVRTNSVDLILMDVITKNGASGLDAAAEIKSAYPNIKIIIVTSMPECSYLSRAREIGIDSFWYKEVSREPILAVMDKTMDGEHIFPDCTPALTLGLASSREFTDRETEVLREMTALCALVVFVILNARYTVARRFGQPYTSGNYRLIDFAAQKFS